MNELLLPKMYKKDIYDINYNLLKEKGIKFLLFDIDNTIADSKMKLPTNEAIILFNHLQKLGFELILFTNALPLRANRFKNALNIECIPMACKPNKRNYIKLMNNKNIKANEIACIGDQLYTDIKGANKCNLYSILVDKISNNEHLITKINRLKENKIYNKYLKRGEYYEK